MDIETQIAYNFHFYLFFEVNTTVELKCFIRFLTLIYLKFPVIFFFLQIKSEQKSYGLR